MTYTQIHSRDILGNRPARLTTVLPGQWVFDSPSHDSSSTTGSEIHIRKYRKRATPTTKPTTSSSASAGTSGAAAAVPINLSSYSTSDQFEDIAEGSEPSHDPLFRAWKQINESQPHPREVVLGEQPAHSSALENCAIITSEDGERILWVFSPSVSSDEQSVKTREIDGLEELNPTLPPINLSQTVTCTKHGSNPYCLQGSHAETSSKPCDISFQPSSELREQIDIMAAALTEKMAWKAGWRLIMRPSFREIRPPLQAALRPLFPTRLLLSLAPSLRPTSSSSPSTSLYPRPLLLSPLSLPAMRLSPSLLTATQDAHLSSKFDHALGYTWKNGKHEAQIRSQLLGESSSDWSIYWVPIIPDPLSPKVMGKLTPRQLAERWQRSKGILTIWPTHLSESYYRRTSSRHSKPILPLITRSEASDLLDIAGGVFDFLSSYREPPPPEEVEDDLDLEPIEEDVTMDGESTIGPDPRIGVEGEDGVFGASPKSDLDDLFSEHSDSPAGQHEHKEDESTPAPSSKKMTPPLDIRLQEEMTMEDNPIEVDGSIDSASQSRAQSRYPPQVPSGNGTEERPEPREEILITEDDFDFFDSPTDGPDHLDEVLKPVVNEVGGDLSAPVPAPTGETQFHQEGMDVDLDELFGQLANGDLERQGPNNSTITEKTQPPNKSETSLVIVSASVPEETIESLSADTQEPDMSTNVPMTNQDLNRLPITQNASIPPPVLLPPSPTLSFPKRSWSSTDLIPPSFSPLPLHPNNGTHTFTYCLPSPAPTPTALRDNLIERLRPPLSKNPCYADVWEMHSEPSEMDEEEEYTGPPTPESTFSEAIEEVVKPTEKKGEEDALEYGGVECLASEWTELIHDSERLERWAIPWNPSWGTGGYPLTPPYDTDLMTQDRKKAPRFEGMDCSRFVQDSVMNKALRRMCGWVENENNYAIDVKSGTPVAYSGILSEGASLSHISNDKPRMLAQPLINAGYTNSIIRLSISSLHYWGELGLQPQGGMKEVEAMVVCEDNEHTSDVATGFLNDMNRAWGTLKLGQHNTSDIGGASPGITAVSASEFPEAVANLLNRSETKTVIYVLLPRLTNITSDALTRLYSLALSPLSTTVVHLIPQEVLSACSFDDIALEVYERLPLSIRPIVHRVAPESWASDPRFPSPPELEEKEVPSYAFTLAKSGTPTPDFSMSWPLRSYDITNLHRLVYTAYTYLEGLGTLVVTAMDELGQAFDLMVYSGLDGLDWRARVKKVYEWSMEKVNMWTIDGRLGVIRYESMHLAELEAWKAILDNSEREIMLLANDPVSRAPSSDTEADFNQHRGLANIPATTLNDPTSHLIDISLSAQLTTFSTRLPVDLRLPDPPSPPLPPSSSPEQLEERTKTIYPISSFGLSIANKGGTYNTEIYHVLYFTSYFAEMTSSESGGKGGGGNSAAADPNSWAEIGEGLYWLICLLRFRWEVDGFGDVLDIGKKGLGVLASASASSTSGAYA